MAFTAASHPTKRGGGVTYNHLTISFLHKPGYIYHILHNNGAHCLNIVIGEEKVSFVITAFTTISLILHHCGIVSYMCARAPELLIMKVDSFNSMNR
jgi:hypothetical protein